MDVGGFADQISTAVIKSVDIVINSLQEVITKLTDGNHNLMIFLCMLPFGFLFVRWLFNMIHFRGK